MKFGRINTVEKETLTLSQKAKGFAQLLKVRLSLLVVFSAVFGYFIAPGDHSISFFTVLGLSLGGFLVTGASNSLNQILEKDYDKQMLRTENRPLPQGILSTSEALVFSIVIALGGITILGWMFNLITALLGIIALLSYAFVYTPMKRTSRLSVLVGAFPGAMPALIGWAAATGGLETGAWILFLFQFIWQFPHFWAIAWILNEDYERAGFKMLPSETGKSSYTASVILVYTILLIPMALFPYQAGMTTWVASGALALAGLAFVYPAYKLLTSLENDAAKKLMFASFLYLPVIQIIFVLDKFLEGLM